MTKIERSPVPGLDPQRVLYEDAAGLAALRSKLDTAAAGSRPMLRGLLLDAFSRTGADAAMLPPPPLPPTRSDRGNSTELLLELRALLTRHGTSAERTQNGNPEVKMLAALEALVRASESIHGRVAAAQKS